MNIETYRNFCLKFEGVTEEFPFDTKTLVFKVHGKMFALFDIETFDSVNLKCEPEKAIDLREEFEAILPGYHMNKKHWNTVKLNTGLDDSLIFDLTKDSYNLVFATLPKKFRK